MAGMTPLGYRYGTGGGAAPDARLSSLETSVSTKITGPATATDNALVVYDSTTGKLAKDSLLTLIDNKITHKDGQTSAVYVNDVLFMDGMIRGTNKSTTLGSVLNSQGTSATPTTTNTALNLGSTTAGWIRVCSLTDGAEISKVGGSDTKVRIGGVLAVDTIGERTNGNGVEIDGVKLKDNKIGLGGRAVDAIADSYVNIAHGVYNAHLKSNGDGFILTGNGTMGISASSEYSYGGNGSSAIKLNPSTGDTDFYRGGILVNKIAANGFQTDLIRERNGGYGVNIDGVLCKDNNVVADNIKIGSTRQDGFISAGVDLHIRKSGNTNGDATARMLIQADANNLNLASDGEKGVAETMYSIDGNLIQYRVSLANDGITDSEGMYKASHKLIFQSGMTSPFHNGGGFQFYTGGLVGGVGANTIGTITGGTKKLEVNNDGVEINNLNITDATASTTTNSGALVVNGGAGIGGAIFAGSVNSLSIGSATAQGTLIIKGNGVNALAINDSLTQAILPVYISNTTVSSSKTTGSLRVAGGVGVAGHVYSGGYFHSKPPANIVNTIQSSNLFESSNVGIDGNYRSACFGHSSRGYIVVSTYNGDLSLGAQNNLGTAWTTLHTSVNSPVQIDNAGTSALVVVGNATAADPTASQHLATKNYVDTNAALISSATWTPTVAIGSGTTAVSVSNSRYERVGNTITWHCQGNATFTTADVLGLFTMTLPVAFGTAVVSHLGSGICDLTSHLDVHISSGTTTATVAGYPRSSGSNLFVIGGSYVVN